MFGKENEGAMNNSEYTWPHIIPLTGRIKDMDFEWKSEGEYKRMRELFKSTQKRDDLFGTGVLDCCL